MAVKITELCINCGACEPECPNDAIYQNGARWELFGETYDPISDELYYVVPDKCTHCVGFPDEEQCMVVCPVDEYIIYDPDHRETEEELTAKKHRLHPED